MFGFMRLRKLTRHSDDAGLSQNRTILASVGTKWQARAAILPLSTLLMLQGQAFAWPDPEKPKPTNGARLQLYPNRPTGLSQQEVDFQNSHAEKLAKSRRNARAHLDAMRVELAWLADPALFAHPPGIKAITSEDKPCVEVRGVVSSHALRQRALELAQRYCESPIRDKLMVLIGPPMPRQSVPTAELQTKAEKYLTDRLLEFSQDLKIEEVYPSGTIRVGGRVLSYEDKLAVSRSLRRLTGCMAVDNRIEVGPMSQDGELITVITSDGETSLPGKLDEKRNGPAVMTRTGGTLPIGSIPGEEARHEAPPLLKPSTPVAAPRTERASTVAEAPVRLARTERLAPQPVAVEAPIERPRYEADERNPLTKPLEFPSGSAKPVLPTTRPAPAATALKPAPIAPGAGATTAAATTGIAVIEEGSTGSVQAQEVQAVVGWGNNPPPAQFNPDGTPVTPPQNTGGLFANRPRLFFQPAVTPPASQRPAPPGQQRAAVRLMPSGNGAVAPQENPEAANMAAAAPAPAPVQTGRPRRTGFLNGLGQPTLPKPQPYLSPLDVVQSGRPGATPARTQPAANPIYLNQSGTNPAGQPMTYGGVSRNLGGQSYQMPGAVRLTPRPESQPGAGPAGDAAAKGVYPWDQPVITDRSPRPLVETNPRTMTTARPEWANQANTAPNTAQGTAGAPATQERAYATPENLGRPIASNNDAFSGNRAPARTNAGFASEAPGPTLGSATIENEPAPFPAAPNNAPPLRNPMTAQRPMGMGDAFPANRPSSPGGASPANTLPAPSTGSAVIEDEGPSIPAFVPANRRAMDEQKSLEKNNRLLQTTPGAVPSIATNLPKPLPGPAPGATPPAVGTGSMTMGTIEIEKDALNRPLPSAQSLTDLAKKTCGSLISDVQTRKDGNALCVEIVVKDALSEDEVLKRLCNLAAFSHPAIRIEVSRGQ